MFRLFLILVITTLTTQAKLNLEVVSEHKGSGYTLQSGDTVFSGDGIKFYFTSDEEATLGIFAIQDGDEVQIHSQKLDSETSSSFPSNSDWIKLDDNIGVETFIFQINGTTVKTFKLNHIARKIDPKKDIKITEPKDPIEHREYIDLAKVKSNTRGADDIKIFKELSSATVIIKAKDEIGTGVIMEQGDILTNWHVVKTSKIVTIAFKPRIGNKPSKGNYYNAEVIKIDRVKDLALLRLLNTDIVEDKQIKAIPFADINTIEVGQDIYTIGHPVGYYYSLSNGIVSSILNDHQWEAQQVQHKANYLIKSQTSSSMGNSGGPLVNKEMELLGLMTYSDTQGQNLNFAVSVNDINEFLQHTPGDFAKTQHIVSHTNNVIKETALTQSHHKTTVLKEMEVYDLDGNFMLLQKLDTNGNAIADMIYLDTNSDNSWDRIYYDKNEDGMIENWKNY